MEISEWSTPSTLNDITEDWVKKLLPHICKIPPKEKEATLSVTSIEIDSSINSGEGALSDISHVSIKATLNKDEFKEDISKNGLLQKMKTFVFDNDHFTSATSELLRNIFDKPGVVPAEQSSGICNEELDIIGSPNNEIRYNLFIKLIPTDLRDLIHNHGLFEREITVYRHIIPLLKDFKRRKSKGSKFKTFQVPNYVCGRVYRSIIDDTSSTNGEHEKEYDNGIVILEDMSSKGYRLVDPDLMLFDLDQMKVAVKAMAEFHGTCIAFDSLSERRLEDLFPILHPKHLIWGQEDMLEFLKSTIRRAEKFIASIEGEGQTARKYSSAMRDPLGVIQQEFERSLSSPFRCLQHGDAWHNNCLFDNSEHGTKFALVDWQICYCGNAVTDLSYLIYTTSTTMFRHEHLDELLHIYFEDLIDVVRELGLSEKQYHPGFDEFRNEFFKSLKFCLLFCANGGDLILKDISNDSAFRTNKLQFKLNNRKTSIATDLQITEAEQRSLQSKSHKNNINKREARAIRRKNFLDVCKEAIKMNVI